jgi:hypothetical protein
MMILSYTDFLYVLLGSAFHTTEVCNSKSKGLYLEKDLNTLSNMYCTDNDVIRAPADFQIIQCFSECIKRILKSLPE